MSGRCFFDTNILVYMQDDSEPKKQEKARRLFTSCVESASAVISTQCMQEFFNITANKMGQDKASIKQIIHNFSQNVPTVQITPTLIENAIDISIKTGFSFWDSLILSAAVSSGCDTLYPEDLNDGQIVEVVTIKNPFK